MRRCRRTPPTEALRGPAAGFETGRFRALSPRGPPEGRVGVKGTLRGNLLRTHGGVIRRLGAKTLGRRPLRSCRAGRRQNRWRSRRPRLRIDRRRRLSRNRKHTLRRLRPRSRGLLGRSGPCSCRRRVRHLPPFRGNSVRRAVLPGRLTPRNRPHKLTGFRVKREPPPSAQASHLARPIRRLQLSSAKPGPR